MKLYGFGFVAFWAVCFLVLTGFTPLYGMPVDEAAVRNAAYGWLSESSIRMDQHLSYSITDIEPDYAVDGSVQGYIVTLAGGGFLYIAPDNLIEPVVAFSAKGSPASLDNTDNPLRALLDSDMPQRLERAAVLEQQLSAMSGQPGFQDIVADPEMQYAQQMKTRWEQYRQDGQAFRAAQFGDTPPAQQTSGREGRDNRQAASDNPDFGQDRYEGSGSINDVRIATLLDTRWSQGTAQGNNCYNYYTPNNYICGCVATAMAQLMRYFSYPTAAIGVNTNTIRVDSSPQDATTRGGDGSGGAYDWDAMPLDPSSATYNESQWAMIGALCYDAGVGAAMAYSSGASTADLADGKEALTNIFQFSSAHYIYNSSGMTATNFRRILDSNLAGRRPVIMGMSRSGGGHAAVCDGFGYSSGTPYHHINMGWAGSDDAWYNLPTIDAAYTYTAVDALIFNVFTNETGEMIAGRLLDSDDEPIASITVAAEPVLIADAPERYTGTSDSNGYYAIWVPAGSAYNVTATTVLGSVTLTNLSVGTSSSYQHEANIGACGNYWGADFVLTNANFLFYAAVATSRVDLMWTSPINAGMTNTKVLIRTDATAYPTSSTDGSLVYEGFSSGLYSYAVPAGEINYYRIWLTDNGTDYMDPPVGNNTLMAFPHLAPIQIMTRSTNTFLEDGKTKTQCRTQLVDMNGSGRIYTNVMPSTFDLATKWTIEGCGNFYPYQYDELIIKDADGNLYLLYFEYDGDLYWSSITSSYCWTSYTLGDQYSTNPASWTMDAIGDVNGDGMDELIMRGTDTFQQGGKTKSWARVLFFEDSDFNNLGRLATNQPAEFSLATLWTVAGMGRFNTTNAGTTNSSAQQLLIQHSTDGGFYLLYFTDNGTLFWDADDTNNLCWTSWSPGSMFATNAADWNVAGIGDVNGDGQDEILINCQDTFSEGGKTKSYKRILFFAEDGSGKLKDTQPEAFKVATRWSLEGLGRFNTTNSITTPEAEQLLLRHNTDGGYYLLYFEEDGTLYWNSEDTNNICWTSFTPGSDIESDAPAWTVQTIGELSSYGIR